MSLHLAHGGDALPFSTMCAAVFEKLSLLQKLSTLKKRLKNLKTQGLNHVHQSFNVRSSELRQTHKDGKLARCVCLWGTIALEGTISTVPSHPC